MIGSRSRNVSTIAVLGAFVLFARAVQAGEGGLTEREYDRIVHTESSVEGEPKFDELHQIHDFSAADERAILDAHGARIIQDRTWFKKTPEQRDADLRHFRDAALPGTRFVLTVPKGDVWAIPAW